MSKGFTIIECLISILLLAIVMAGGMAFYFYSNEYFQGSIHKKIAVEIINSDIEKIRKDGFAELPDADGLWKSEDQNIRGLTGFTNNKRIYVYQVDKNGDGNIDYKHVRIELNWQEAGKQTQQAVRLDTYISP